MDKELERRIQQKVRELEREAAANRPPNCSCGLQMVKRFGRGDYYCPICGIYQRDLDNDKKSRKAEQQTLDNQATIEAKIEANPLYRFIRRLTIKILEEHGFSHNVIFRNMKGGRCEELDDGTFQVKFGYYAIKYLAKHGFQEYPKSYGYLWPAREEMTGKKACWAFAIHEAAHAVQISKNGRWHGSEHNAIWANAVQELQILYPWDEVKDL